MLFKWEYECAKGTENNPGKTVTGSYIAKRHHDMSGLIEAQGDFSLCRSEWPQIFILYADKVRMQAKWAFIVEISTAFADTIATLQHRPRVQAFPSRLY